MENKVKDIEIYKLEDFEKINEFKTTLVEIKYKGNVEFVMSYFPTLKLIGIHEYNHKGVFKDRLFHEYDCGSLKLSEHTLNIPYKYFVMGEDEAALFLKVVCETFKEYFDFIKQNKDELFKDRLILDGSEEELKSRADMILDYFFSPFWISVGFTPSGRSAGSYLGVLSDILQERISVKNSDYTHLYYKLRNNDATIAFSFDNMEYAIDFTSIGEKDFLSLYRGQDRKLVTMIPKEEWTNTSKIMRVRDNMSTILAIIASYYYYRSITDEGLFSIAKKLKYVLQCDSFSVMKDFNKDIAILNWGDSCSLFIRPMKYNGKRYFKVIVNTGIVDTYEDSDVLYHDIMKEEEAIDYTTDIIAYRLHGYIPYDLKERVEEIFNIIYNEVEAQDVLEYDNCVCLSSYQKDSGGNVNYIRFSFFSSDGLIEETRHFEKNSLDDLLLRENEEDFGYYNVVESKVIDVNTIKDTLVYDIYKKFNK